MQNIDERVLQYMPFFGNWVFKDPPEMLGRGNSGTVYRIWNKDSGGMLDAAMKVIPIPRDEKQVEAWLKEAGGSGIGLQARIQQELEYVKTEIRTMETLKADSHIVCFEDYKIYKCNDTPLGWDVLIRMERLVGLDDFLRNIDKYPHKRGQQLVLTIWDELLSGLSLCERNHVLHLDIKPDNIFYAEPSKDYFKLGDFGVSIRNEKSKIAGQGTRVGTIDYMSPEMYNFKGSDSRSDMYSLAVVVYELLNNRRLPFMGPNDTNNLETRYQKSMYRLSGKEKIPPIKGVDNRLMQIVLKCLAYNPNDRFENIQQVQDALRAYRYGGGGTIRETPSKPKSKLPLFLGLGIGGVALLVFLLTRVLGPDTDDNTSVAIMPTDTVVGEMLDAEPPVTEAPETEPPETEPPVTEPPETEPPVTEAPETEPPETEPPVTEAPVTEPPETEPPVTEPPVTEAPETEPPVTEPPVTEPPVTEPPLEALRLELVDALTEDDPVLMVQSNRPVEVTLYYFKNGEEMTIDDAHMAAEFTVAGEVSQDLSAITLNEGDSYALVYRDEDGAEQRQLFTVGASTREDIAFEVDDLVSVDAQAWPVVRGSYLSGSGSASPNEVLTVEWRPLDGDVEAGSVISVVADGKGSFDFSLYSEDYDIGESGVTGEIIVSYAGGISVSRAHSQTVVWTLDEQTWVSCDAVMDQDRAVSIHGEPLATMELLKDGVELGEALGADDEGNCVWQLDEPLNAGEILEIRATDVFGNVESTGAIVMDYRAGIDNLEEGALRDSEAVITGRVRAGMPVDVRFVDEAGESHTMLEGLEPLETGEITAQVLAEDIPGADASSVTGYFELAQEDGGAARTDAFLWELKTRLAVSEPDEDSEALVIESEPGATVAVLREDGYVYEYEVPEDGVVRHVPEEGFFAGDVYTVSASDPDHSNRDNERQVTVTQANRAMITVDVPDAISLPRQENPTVKGGLLTVTGQAQPGMDVLVEWSGENDSTLTVATAGDDGTYTADLDAFADTVNGTVRASYADGKAADMGGEYPSILTWTTDEAVAVTVMPIMVDAGNIIVYTDPEAEVTVSRNGNALVTQMADTEGYFDWHSEEAMQTGDVYHIVCEDSFGNVAEQDAEVLEFSAGVSNVQRGVVKGDTASLVGSARPNEQLEIYLVSGSQEYAVNKSITTDDSGLFDVDIASGDIDGFDVDGQRVSFRLVAGDDERQTDSFAWNVTLRVTVDKPLTEDSKSMVVRTEGNALLEIVRRSPDKQVVYDGPVEFSGVYTLEPEGFFLGGEIYDITVTDPDDPNRKSESDSVTIEEAPRADIQLEIKDLIELQGIDKPMVRGGSLEVSGSAQPNTQLVLWWTGEGGIENVTADVGANGRFDAGFAATDTLQTAAISGHVEARYADGKARSIAGVAQDLLWTADDAVDVSIDPAMEGETTFTVRTEPYARVTVYVNGDKLDNQEHAVDLNGVYTANLGKYLATGDVCRAEVTDQFGNTNAAEMTVAEDPYKTIDLILESGRTINAATQELVITGEAEPGKQVVLYINDMEQTVDVGGDGKLRYAAPVDSLSVVPVEGMLQIKAAYTDGHVNRSSVIRRVTVDRTVPALQTNLALLSARDSRVEGSTEAHAKVLLMVGDKEYTTSADQDGFFGIEGVSLSNNVTVSITATDAVGNASETETVTIGLQEAARMDVTVSGNKLRVSGWLVCDELNDMVLKTGSITSSINARQSQVEPEDLIYDLADYEQQEGVAINTDGKICVRINQEVDISNLSAGTYDAVLMVDDFADERTLATATFTKEAGASSLSNESVINDAGTFAFGLDDSQPMNGRGILLTGWYYGPSANDTYTISEIRVVDPRDDDENMADPQEVSASLNISGELSQGYAKLIRKGLEEVCPRAFLSQLEGVNPVERNAGFMIWIDGWELEDGDYKVIVTVLAGGEKYRTSAGITVDNSRRVINSDRLAEIAEEWDPKPVEETPEPEMNENG